MQAIVTKWLAPTNSRGSRIKVWSQSRSITVSWDHAVHVEENHRLAIGRLAILLGWSGDWVMGAAPEKGNPLAYVALCVKRGPAGGQVIVDECNMGGAAVNTLARHPYPDSYRAPCDGCSQDVHASEQYREGSCCDATARRIRSEAGAARGLKAAREIMLTVRMDMPQGELDAAWDALRALVMGQEGGADAAPF